MHLCGTVKVEAQFEPKRVIKDNFHDEADHSTRRVSMINKLRSLLFKPKEENKDKQLKILLIHQNLELTEEQKQQLLAHIQDAVHNFVYDELKHEPSVLELITQKPEKNGA